MESSVTLVVYHLPKISGNLGQKYPFEKNEIGCFKPFAQNFRIVSPNFIGYQ